VLDVHVPGTLTTLPVTTDSLEEVEPYNDHEIPAKSSANISILIFAGRMIKPR